MALAVANRYAQALADLILAPDSGLDAQEVAGHLREIGDIVESSVELRNVLLNPAVGPARKRAVISRLTEPLGVSRLLRNFLFVIVDRRRIAVLGDIRRAFEDVVDERKGIVRVDVTSTADLSDEQRGALRNALGDFTGKQVRCEYALDEDLLGGAVVQIGSTVYDGSIRGQLDEIKKRLTE